VSIAGRAGTHKWFIRAYGALCKLCGMQRHESVVRTTYIVGGLQVSDSTPPLCPGVGYVDPDFVKPKIIRTPVK
jgi:hypothetical protein